MNGCPERHLQLAWKAMLLKPISDETWSTIYQALKTNDPHEAVKHRVTVAAFNWQRAQADIDRSRNPNWKAQQKRWSEIQNLSERLLSKMDDGDAILHANWGQPDDRIDLDQIEAMLRALIERSAVMQDLTRELHVKGQKAPSRHTLELYAELLAIWKNCTGLPASRNLDESRPSGQKCYGDCVKFLEASLREIMGQHAPANSTIGRDIIGGRIGDKS